MTHKELTAGDRRGFASDCPGELAHQDDYPDEVVTPEGARPRTVSVYTCGRCGAVIPTAGGVVLNVYDRPDVGRLARDLVDEWEGGENSSADDRRWEG